MNSSHPPAIMPPILHHSATPSWRIRASLKNSLKVQMEINLFEFHPALLLNVSLEHIT